MNPKKGNERDRRSGSGGVGESGVVNQINGIERSRIICASLGLAMTIDESVEMELKVIIIGDGSAEFRILKVAENKFNHGETLFCLERGVSIGLSAL